MSKIRMVCTDLDGTLFDASSRISARNRQALRRCIARGIRVYLVTGRPYCFARYQALGIAEEAGCICANGACIADPCNVDKALLLTHEIRKESLEKFIEALRETGCRAVFKSLLCFYTHDNYDERFLYQHRKELFTDEIRLQTYTRLSWEELKERAEGILKVLVYNEDRAALAVLRERAERIKGLNVSSYNEMSIDVTANGVDKGAGIREACLKTGIRREEILSVGDAWNDLPMFEASGFVVAMGNAQEEIRRRADAVTGPNTQDGVAEAIERFVLA